MSTIAHDDATRIGAYLASGVQLSMAWGMEIDLFDPEEHRCVPIGEACDDLFTWTLADVYYLEHYGQAALSRLADALVAHIRSRDYQFPQISDEQRSVLTARYFERRSSDSPPVEPGPGNEHSAATSRPPSPFAPPTS